MKETIDKAVTWLKANPLLAIGAAAAAVLLLFPKLLRLGRSRRRRRYSRPVVHHTRRRHTRRSYTKGGKAKKAWQIKGSPAARRHMAQIRRLKRA